MNRAPKLQNFIDKFSKKEFGHIQGGKKDGLPVCVFCGKRVNTLGDFRDDLSIKEFGISGICQTCQDETFK